MGCTGGKFVSEETRINRALRQRYFDARRAYHDELREASFCSNRSMRRSNMEFLARQQSEAMAEWLRYARPVAVVQPVHIPSALTDEQVISMH